jgi:hypothetical protein
MQAGAGSGSNKFSPYRSPFSPNSEIALKGGPAARLAAAGFTLMAMPLDPALVDAMVVRLPDMRQPDS